MKETIASIFAAIIIYGSSGLYLFGMYKVFADEYRYTRKQTGFAIIIPFYPVWIGANELHYLLTIPKEERMAINSCLELTQDYIRMKKRESIRGCSDPQARDEFFKLISELSKSQYE